MRKVEPLSLFSSESESSSGRKGWPALVALFASMWLFSACASERLPFRDQVDRLVYELTQTKPAKTEDVVEFVTARSHLIDLDLEGIDQTLLHYLLHPGPWERKVLMAYLLSLARSTEGFEAMIDQLDASEGSPELREGLQYAGMKYLGFTEREDPPLVVGWEEDLAEWSAALDRIREIGLHGWRLDYLREIVLSGTLSSGGEAIAAASWLSYTLEPEDVPFLNDLLEKGSAGCDVALLAIIEDLVMRSFLPVQGEEGIEEGLAAFRSWYEPRAALPPDAWITESFVQAGYPLEDLYSQKNLAKVVPALLDDSAQWVLVRGHTLAAINRICGFHVDRAVIFMGEDLRREVIRAALAWYQEMAARVKLAYLGLVDQSKRIEGSSKGIRSSSGALGS